MSNVNFAKTITNLIESNSLNQLTFANAVKVNQSQVSDWISGKSKPSFEALRDICIRFNISADYLLGLSQFQNTFRRNLLICNYLLIGHNLNHHIFSCMILVCLNQILHSLLGLKEDEVATKFKIANRRYTGSKLKLKDWIKDLIIKNCFDCSSFCDIFAGTGVITDTLINEYDTFIVNDFLFSNEIIYKAFHNAQQCLHIYQKNKVKKQLKYCILFHLMCFYYLRYLV